MYLNIIWQDKTLKVLFQADYRYLAGLMGLISRCTGLPINDIDASFKDKDGRLSQIDVDDDIDEFIKQSKTNVVEVFVQEKGNCSDPHEVKGSFIKEFGDAAISDIKSNGKNTDVVFSDINMAIFSRKNNARSESPDFERYKPVMKLSSAQQDKPVTRQLIDNNMTNQPEKVPNNTVTPPKNACIALTSQIVVHTDAECDHCGIYPLTGRRFMCLRCHDYDLCEECGLKNVHGHEMIQLQKPVTSQELSSLLEGFIQRLKDPSPNNKQQPGNYLKATDEHAEAEMKPERLSVNNLKIKDIIVNHIETNENTDVTSHDTKDTLVKEYTSVSGLTRRYQAQGVATYYKHLDGF